jgi:hypothetical protein
VPVIRWKSSVVQSCNTLAGDAALRTRKSRREGGSVQEITSGTGPSPLLNAPPVVVMRWWFLLRVGCVRVMVPM